MPVANERDGAEMPWQVTIDVGWGMSASCSVLRIGRLVRLATVVGRLFQRRVVGADDMGNPLCSTSD